MSMPVYLIAKCRRCGRRLSGWNSQVCHCDRMVNVRAGGMGLQTGTVRDAKCPRCKAEEYPHTTWFNHAVDWKSRYCLFVVDEVEV